MPALLWSNMLVQIVGLQLHNTDLDLKLYCVLLCKGFFVLQDVLKVQANGRYRLKSTPKNRNYSTIRRRATCP